MTINPRPPAPRRFGPVLACLLALSAACTQVKPVTTAAVSPSPGGSPTASADDGLVGFPTTSPDASGGPVSPTPLSLPTPTRQNGGALPQPSFTPAVITALCSPDACVTGPAPVPSNSAANGATGAASPSPGASGAASPSPVPSKSPFPASARVNNTHLAVMAVDASNNLWVGDKAQKNVLMYTLDGAINGTFAAGIVPGAMAFDTNGHLWVQSADLGTLVQFDQGGGNLGTVNLSVLGLPTDIPLIAGLAPIAGGGMWVANAEGANTVTHIDATGKDVKTIESPGSIAAIASDAAGNLWIAVNDTHQELAKFAPDGTALGEFTDVRGLQDYHTLAVDSGGTVWLAGRNTPTGQPTQGKAVGFAGTGTVVAEVPLGVDRAPVSLTFDVQGNLVFAIAPGPAQSHSHVGFLRISKAGQVLDDVPYDAPTQVVEDRVGKFWGLDPTVGAFRFPLPLQ